MTFFKNDFTNKSVDFFQNRKIPRKNGKSRFENFIFEISEKRVFSIIHTRKYENRSSTYSFQGSEKQTNRVKRGLDNRMGLPFTRRAMPGRQRVKEISGENHSLKLRQVLVLFLKLSPFSNAQYRQNFRLRRAFGARFPFSNTQILLKFSACGGRFHLVMLKHDCI